MKKFLASAILATILATPALASAFWGGTVINVADDDVLYLRKWPAATSQVVGTYDDGDNISLTGRCKNTVSNVSFRVDAGGSTNWKYSKMRKSNVWCQAMSGTGRLGWVRGKYVWPE